MNPFSFLLPAPTLKAIDAPSYKFALDAWKETVAEMIKLYPHLFNAQSIQAPTMAAPAPEKVIVEDIKGEWEKRWNETGKRLRMTPRLLELYETREAYAKALCEGTTKDETQEEKVPVAQEVGDWH